MDEKALGKRLQSARKRAGLTQQELCQKAHLSYSTLAKIERGAIKAPSVFTVAHIASVTGVNLEELLDIRASSATVNSRKRSKAGVSFVYFDVNDTLVRFFHKAFSDIGELCGLPPDMIETIYWRRHQAISLGKITMEEFNARFAKDLGLNSLDWREYYLNNVETMPGVKDLVEWAAQNYQVGLLSNNMPGLIDEMLQNGTLPKVNYASIVDSSKVGLLKPDQAIFEKAQQMAGADAKEILLIDNDRPNLIAADQTGWQVAWFDDLDPLGSVERAKAALAF